MIDARRHHFPGDHYPHPCPTDEDDWPGCVSGSKRYSRDDASNLTHLLCLQRFTWHCLLQHQCRYRCTFARTHVNKTRSDDQGFRDFAIYLGMLANAHLFCFPRINVALTDGCPVVICHDDRRCSFVCSHEREWWPWFFAMRKSSFCVMRSSHALNATGVRSYFFSSSQ